MTVVAADTSPLNYLALTGEIEILRRLYGWKFGQLRLSTDSLQFDISDCRMGLGNWFSILPQPLKVQLDGFPDIVFDLLDGSTGRDASGQIGNVGGKIVFALFNYDGVLPHGLALRPA